MYVLEPGFSDATFGTSQERNFGGRRAYVMRGKTERRGKGRRAREEEGREADQVGGGGGACWGLSEGPVSSVALSPPTRYSVEGFIDKNRDSLFQDFKRLLYNR